MNLINNEIPVFGYEEDILLSGYTPTTAGDLKGAEFGIPLRGSLPPFEPDEPYDCEENVVHSPRPLLYVLKMHSLRSLAACEDWTAHHEGEMSTPFFLCIEFKERGKIKTFLTSSANVLLHFDCSGLDERLNAMRLRSETRLIDAPLTNRSVHYMACRIDQELCMKVTRSHGEVSARDVEMSAVIAAEVDDRFRQTYGRMPDFRRSEDIIALVDVGNIRLESEIRSWVPTPYAIAVGLFRNFISRDPEFVKLAEGLDHESILTALIGRTWGRTESCLRLSLLESLLNDGHTETLEAIFKRIHNLAKEVSRSPLAGAMLDEDAGRGGHFLPAGLTWSKVGDVLEPILNITGVIGRSDFEFLREDLSC